MRFAAVAVIASLALGGCFHQSRSKSSAGATIAGAGLIAAALGGLALAAPSEDNSYDSYQNESNDDALGVVLLAGGLATALVGAMVASDHADEPEPSYMVSAYPPPCVVCVVPLPPPPPPPPSPCPCPPPY